MAASRYRIVIRGRLSERFESAFDGMTLEHGPNRTVLVGDVRDQAQLYGLLGRLQEFGIELLAVESTDICDGGSEPGAGHLPRIHPAAGRTRLRRARMGEFIALLRECLSGGKVIFAGDYYQVRGFRLGEADAWPAWPAPPTVRTAADAGRLTSGAAPAPAAAQPVPRLPGRGQAQSGAG